jgi:hypothetical protein
MGVDRAPVWCRLTLLAGVVQWQNGSFPSCIRGFDSLRPLQDLADFSLFGFTVGFAGFAYPLSLPVGREFSRLLRERICERLSRAP